MTSHKHFKDTVVNRRKVYGLTYQQARRQVLDQLQLVADFPHLPTVWDIARTPFEPRPSVERHRAALGAAHLALRGGHVFGCGATWDSWRTLDGHIDIDWRGGPFAHEVVQHLIRTTEDSEGSTLDPGELTPGVDRIGHLNAVWIGGVRVRFHPYKAIAPRPAAPSPKDNRAGNAQQNGVMQPLLDPTGRPSVIA